MSPIVNNRIVAIAGYFAKNSTGTFEELAARLGVSVRSVRDDVARLNELLDGTASLEAHQGVLNMLVYDSQGYASKLAGLLKAGEPAREDSAQWREGRLFGLLLHATGPVTTEVLANKLHMSRSTLTTVTRQLKQDAAPYGISILGKPNSGLWLDGDEIQLRLYAIERAFEPAYGDKELPEAVANVVRAGARRISSEQNVLTALMRYSTVMVDRFSGGHTIRSLGNLAHGVFEGVAFGLVDALVSEIGAVTGCTYPKNERVFVALSVMGARVPGDVSDVMPVELDTDILALAQSLVKAISDDLNVPISLGDLTCEFLYHLKAMLNRLRYSIRLKNPMVEDMRSHYPLEWEATGIASQVLDKRLGLPLTDDERGYLAEYLSVILEHQRRSSRRVARIAIVGGSERITAFFIESQLRRSLDESKAEVSLFTRSEVSAPVLEKFDIVLSTTVLPFETAVPVLLINEVFDPVELAGRIQRSLSWAIPLSFATTGVHVAIASHLDERHFFVLSAQGGYLPAVMGMVRNLTAAGELDAGFADRLCERETQRPTIFGTSVALPHCAQSTSHAVVLALGVFHHPVSYGGGAIEVVFLLGTPIRSDLSGADIIRYYDEIVSVAQDQRMVDRLSQSCDFREARQALQA